MRKPTISLLYQHDPWNSSIGGIQTMVNYFLKYIPNDFEVRFAGVSAVPGVELNRWHRREFCGRDVQFLPLLYIPDDNHRRLIPTSLRYTMALLRHNLSSDFIHFYRLEPCLVGHRWSGEKTWFVQNDVYTQVMGTEGSKGAILWRHAPSLYLRLEQQLLPQFTEIWSCNTDALVQYRERYPNLADRLSLVPNTFDEEVFYPLGAAERNMARQAFAAERGLAPETRFILFAGRLHPQKDPLLLIQSFAQLPLPDVHLLIAGDGEMRADVEAEIQRLGLGDRITLLGPVTPARLAQLHQLSSICLLTSLYEGLPLVILEALACGTPVVSTRCGETPRVLSEGSGLICEGRSPQAVATTIQQVLQQPQHYTAEACLRAAQPYNAKVIVEDRCARMLERWSRQQVPTSLPLEPIPA